MTTSNARRADTSVEVPVATPASRLRAIACTIALGALGILVFAGLLLAFVTLVEFSHLAIAPLNSGPMRPWVALPMLLVFGWLGFLASVATHEAGHALAASRRGVRVLAYSVWSWTWIRQGAGWRLHRGRRWPGGPAGFILTDGLPRAEGARRTMAAIAAAGPIASILTVLISAAAWLAIVLVILVLSGWDSTIFARVALFLVAALLAGTMASSVFLAIYSGIPFPPSWMRGLRNDGWRLIELLRSPGSADELICSSELSRLFMEVMLRTRPRDLDRRQLASLLWRDLDRRETSPISQARLLVASHRIDLGQYRQAERALRWVERRLMPGAQGDLKRHAIGLSLASIDLIARGDVASARMRLARTPSLGVFAVERGQVEAAILDAEGKRAEAVKVARRTLKLARRTWCVRGTEEDLEALIEGREASVVAPCDGGETGRRSGEGWHVDDGRSTVA
jgi:hypothetical protein